MVTLASDIEGDFEDEDTFPGVEETPVEGPRYELMWVEQPGMGMVLRVVRVGAREEVEVEED
jgi:hypothetical protein